MQFTSSATIVVPESLPSTFQIHHSLIWNQLDRLLTATQQQRVCGSLKGTIVSQSDDKILFLLPFLKQCNRVLVVTPNQQEARFKMMSMSGAALSSDEWHMLLSGKSPVDQGILPRVGCLSSAHNFHPHHQETHGCEVLVTTLHRMSELQNMPLNYYDMIFLCSHSGAQIKWSRIIQHFRPNYLVHQK